MCLAVDHPSPSVPPCPRALQHFTLSSLNHQKCQPSHLPLPERPQPPPPPRLLPKPLRRPRQRRLPRLPLLPTLTLRRRGERPGRRPTPPTSTKVRVFKFILFNPVLMPRVPVLKQVHPDTGISNKAMAILNSFVNDIFERIATEASSTSSSLTCSEAVNTYDVPLRRTRVILEKVDHLITRNSNCRPPHPPRRIGQARHLRRDQVRDEVLICRCQVNLFRSWMGFSFSCSLFPFVFVDFSYSCYDIIRLKHPNVRLSSRGTAVEFRSLGSQRFGSWMIE